MTNKKDRKRARTMGLGVFAVLSATTVAFLFLISAELAATASVLLSVALLILFERNRRANWEQAVDFKFMTMTHKHAALAREILRYRNQLDGVSDDVSLDANKGPVSFGKILKKSVSVKQPQSVKTIKPANVSKKKNAQTLPKDSITKRNPRLIKVVEDGDSLSDLVVEELMEHAVKNKRIDVFIQPILRLPQRQRKSYEVFSRVRAKPGVYIPAGRYMGIAKKNKQIQDIDALMLTQCLKAVQKCGTGENAPLFFINITSNTLRDAQFMGRLLSFLSKNKELAKQLVFEMKQKEFHGVPIPVLQVINGLSKLGCSFSLDHVTTLNEDIPDLQSFSVRYLKIDAALLLETARDERQYKAMMKAKRLLEGNGIGVIAEKIEDEETMRKLLDFGLRYGQGYLFGRPDLQGAYEPALLAKYG